MNTTPDGAAPIRRLPARALQALGEFLRLEAAAGVLLIGAAVLALLCANSPLHDAYEQFRGVSLTLGADGFSVSKSLLLWINDGLMAVFFLLVALEIKREALTGQLAGRQQLVLPLVCACAGVAVPALLFTLLNQGDGAAMRGWAVPAATDIAFALGMLSLLGPRVPVGMKLLLSTIAVVDDLIAILIIAVFYAHGVSWMALGGAVAIVLAMWLLNRRGVTALTPYLLLGAVLWACVLQSGVHATLAGVVTGLLIPHVDPRNTIPDDIEHSPLEHLEHALHAWGAYAILPLVAGKPVGVVGAAVVMRTLRWAPFPVGMDLRAMVGLGLLCGIGFTMSLFIAALAYHHPLHYEQAVLGVLGGSLVAAVLGYLWLRAVLPPRSADAT
jgi:NhaA family Na+:H+ antiporter